MTPLAYCHTVLADKSCWEQSNKSARKLAECHQAHCGPRKAQAHGADPQWRVIGNSRATVQIMMDFLSAQLHDTHLGDVDVGQYSMASPITGDIKQAYRSLKKKLPQMSITSLQNYQNIFFQWLLFFSPKLSIVMSRTPPPSRAKALIMGRRFQADIYIPGIHLRKALDTIDTHELLLVLGLNSEPQRSPAYKGALQRHDPAALPCSEILRNLCKQSWYPQGDDLSPLVLVVYLEVLLRDRCHHLRVAMRELNTIVIADDVDLIHHDPPRLEHILLVAEQVFRSWSLTINVCKTEKTTIARATSVAANLGAKFANWDHYLATPKTYSNENMTQQQHSEDFGNFGSILIFFRNHYASACTMSMCFLFCYTIVVQEVL
uniref:AlNc14C130G6908 protein n=1 Tax=Albugo laibachii Nc14 TaxID=890382 RepID=F0WK57_9STRA|nr:AlNc14C130G6908 [Albugo laibachii Nc14]|eukprot:CCA21659.1 AlNc14C130G6908 [Albugo laibachii Nc14]